MNSTRLHTSIHEIDQKTWDSLNPNAYPGLLHGFLSALEDSNSVGEGTGWNPLYVTANDSNGLAAAMACFIKSDSYGEYVFDWAWADAYQKHGLSYYPKCITAIPFTPATGPRVLYRPEVNPEVMTRSLFECVFNELSEKISSWHILFPDSKTESLILKNGQWVERHGVQFHWLNKDFRNFEDHLALFNSKRRKEAKRERRRVKEQGITFELLKGSELDNTAIETVFQCYQRTYTLRGRRGYLTQSFFELARDRIPNSIRVAFAKQHGQKIAMSLCLVDRTTLYGRYWGALVNADCLHFETCFHQWIEYAIAEGIERFDPGAQGEHKIARGFHPVKTKSLHWIANPEFYNAISDFVARERQHIQLYFQDCDEHTPFKQLEAPIVLK